MSADEDKVRLEYETTLQTWRMLADVRFKLLALVPSVSGFAIALLSKDLLAQNPSPEPVLAVGILGFLVTLGITIYDQRNSQLSNMAFFHARELEHRLGLPLNGHLRARPGRQLRFLGVFQIWHDRGLALIYGSVLGAWIFPMTLSALSVFTDCGRSARLSIAGIAATVSVVAFVVELHRLDRSASRNPYD